MYEELYEQNKGLLILMARRYRRICELDPAVSEEDLMQAGFIALMRATEKYDENTDKSWVSWACWFIQRELESALGMRAGKFTRAHTGAKTLDRPLSPLNEDGTTALDALADESLGEPDESLLLEELRQGVREAVERLKDDRQRRVVQLCKLEGRSYQDVAAELGVDPCQVRRLYGKARNNLSRDHRLQMLADLDEHTHFYAHKGVAAFNRDWTSVTEGAALWRIGQWKAATAHDC